MAAGTLARRNYGQTYLAGSGNLTGEKAAEMVGGLHHSAVAADVRH